MQLRGRVFEGVVYLHLSSISLLGLSTARCILRGQPAYSCWHAFVPSRSFCAHLSPLPAAYMLQQCLCQHLALRVWFEAA
jgi:hypothetical protein